MSAQFYLAQMNLVRVKYPVDDPRMDEFVDHLDRINALADDADGFIWRFQAEHDVYDEDILLNMSVWDSVASLKNYVYGGEHLAVMKQGHKWADKIAGNSTVLWWIPASHLPSDYEAKERMDYLNAHGPSEHAFTFAKTFDAPERAVVENEFA